MKALGIIALVFSFAVSAHAVRFSSVKHLQDKQVDAFVKAFVAYGSDDSVFAGQAEARAHKISVKDRESSESWLPLIKGAVAWVRANDGATPGVSDLTVRRIVKQEREMQLAIKRHALRGATGEESAEAAHDLHAALHTAVSGYRHLKLYVGTDNSDNVDCAFVAVLDEDNSEIALTSSCVAQ